MSDQAGIKSKKYLWLGIGLTAGFVTGYKIWLQYKSRQNSPLIKEQETLWALVTGADSGIGATYARRLAQQNYNVVLVGSQTKHLEKLAEAFAGHYQVRIQVLTSDLSTTEGVEQVESLISSLKNLNLLVNNSGFGNDELTAHNNDMLLKHVATSVRLTRAALPGMLAQKRGAVVNVSHLIDIYLSGGAVYGAPKSYLNAFTNALHRELAGSGVRVQVLYPGFRLTMGQKVTAVQDIEQAMVENTVDRSMWDLANDRVVSVPGFAYRMLLFSAPYLPTQMIQSISMWITKFGRQSSPFSGFRKRMWSNFNEFTRDIDFMLKNRELLHLAMQVLDRDLFRRLMLVVTHVNGCRYCANYHSKSALTEGMAPEEVEDLLDGVIDRVPEKEIPALLYALYWAEEGGHSDPNVRQDLVDRYGEEMTRAIESALQMIKIGNYMGNTWDFILYSISGGRWGNETR